MVFKCVWVRCIKHEPRKFDISFGVGSMTGKLHWRCSEELPGRGGCAWCWMARLMRVVLDDGGANEVMCGESGGVADASDSDARHRTKRRSKRREVLSAWPWKAR